MTRSAKKDLEKECVVCFIRLARLRGWRLLKQMEQPDSIICSAKGREKIGIEVTQYHHNPKAKNTKFATEMLWRKCQRELHEARAQIPRNNTNRELSGRLYFRNNSPPATRYVTVFVQELLQQIGEIEHLVKPGRDYVFATDKKFQTLEKYLNKVKLVRVPGASCLIWDAPNISGGQFGIQEKELEDILDEKDDKFSTYKANVGNLPVGLLISAIGSSIWNSIVFERDLARIVRKAHKRILRSPFQIIWVVDNRYEWALEIKAEARKWANNFYKKKWHL